MTLIIGSGRIATHFRHYFKISSLPFTTWSRKENTLLELKNLAANAGKILLLISDDKIFEFYQEFLAEIAAPVIHFSGSLNLPPLISLHPLMTFGLNLFPDDFYQKIYFAAPPGLKFLDYYPELKNPSFELPLAARPLYHAYCVAAGNLPSLIWSQTLPALQQMKIPPEAIALYLQQTLVSSLANPSLAPTGPIARGDQKIISIHLSILPPKLRKIYCAFVDTFLDIKGRFEAPEATL